LRLVRGGYVLVRCQLKCLYLMRRWLDRRCRRCNLLRQLCCGLLRRLRCECLHLMRRLDVHVHSWLQGVRQLCRGHLLRLHDCWNIFLYGLRSGLICDLKKQLLS